MSTAVRQFHRLVAFFYADERPIIIIIIITILKQINQPLLEFEPRSVSVAIQAVCTVGQVTGTN